MNLVIHNTLTKKKEKFIPVDSKHVRVYTCGPTVYNYAHIGNARPAVVSDLLVRVLRCIYPKVTYASNITDIDDKIIKASLETGMSISEITTKYEKIYNEDMNALGVINPDIQPHATDYIEAMISMINKNLDNNKAYISKGHVLFDVSSYKSYGKLSGRDKDDQLAGSRVAVADYKKNPGDFILWKPSVDNQPGWDSPWGYGRPGWHLECSVMSEETLGIPFDIHCGGMDLIFPHHENEIAQTCGSCNEQINPTVYVKYWMHNALLNIDGEKMSKSLGNIIYIRNLLEKYNGEVLRLALLSGHYRHPLNFTDKTLEHSKGILDRLYRILAKIKHVEIDKDKILVPPVKVLESLCDDLNTSKAVAEIMQIYKKISSNIDNEDKIKKYKTELLSSGYLIGILQNSPDDWLGLSKTSSLVDADIVNQLIKERSKARSEKDFSKADNIRDKLLNMGIEIEDTPEGTTWRNVK
tara:strand:+ start:1823 stop:3226 length:1404 start_codon:yes stop_codon:yes gene_type:complete